MLNFNVEKTFKVLTQNEESEFLIVNEPQRNRDKMTLRAMTKQNALTYNCPNMLLINEDSKDQNVTSRLYLV